MQFCKFDQKSYIRIYAFTSIWRLYLYASVLPFFEPNLKILSIVNPLRWQRGKYDNDGMFRTSSKTTSRVESTKDKNPQISSTICWIFDIVLSVLFLSVWLTCSVASETVKYMCYLGCGIGCFKSFFREQQRFIKIYNTSMSPR